jgi:hypothetical protein
VDANPSDGKEAEGLRKTALGLTLLNAALGLALWALVGFALSVPPRLVALLGTAGGFLAIVAFVHCAFVPAASYGRPFAWTAAGAIFLYILVHLFAFAQESEPFFLGQLVSGGLAAAACFGYLLLLILFCRARRPGNGALIHWCVTVGLLVGMVAVGFLLPLLAIAAERNVVILGVSQLILIGALSTLLLRMRRLVLAIAKGEAS